MADLPDPSASRAVLVGAGAYQALDDLPAVEHSVEILGELFGRQDIWGLPAEHRRVVIDPQTPRQLSKPVAEAAQEATDALIIYYAGHGLIEPRTGQLHLAVRESDRRSVHDTAAPYEWIRRSIQHSTATRKIVVIDCCYSARAFGVQSAEASFEVEGTYLLAACAENAVAIAPPGEPYTAFTGELITLISNGDQEGGEFLDLDVIYKKLRLELGLKGMPEPHRLCRNSLGSTPLVRNTAFRALKATSGSSWSTWTASHSSSPAVDSTETEPYVRLKSLRHLLDQLILQLSPTQSLSDTLQNVAEGVVAGLAFDAAALNLVRPDGDFVVAAVAGNPAAGAEIVGQVGSRASWERRLSMGEAWGNLRFIPHVEGSDLADDVPEWQSDGPEPESDDDWHPKDRLLAPMYSGGSKELKDLTGVISVDRPRTGRRPGAWGREALQVYAAHAAVAISNAQLRSNMQRGLARLKHEGQSLRADGEAFQQAFEYAPSGIGIAEFGGEQHGKILRANDALCRILNRSPAEMCCFSFTELVHPEDLGALLQMHAEGGRAELRLTRRNGTCVWVSMRNSVIADTSSGPQLLLTHVQDIAEPRLLSRG